MDDEPLDEWAARRDARRPAPGDRKAVPLGEGPERGAHVDPDVPRVMLEWDGHQWQPGGVADPTPAQPSTPHPYRQNARHQAFSNTL